MSRFRTFASWICLSILVLQGCSSMSKGSLIKENASSKLVDQVSSIEDSNHEVKATTKRYKPGTYKGRARGRNGIIIARVTVSSDTIIDIELSHKESESVIDGQDDLFIKEMIESNRINIDNISGATITSEAIKEAVSIALTEAR